MLPLSNHNSTRDKVPPTPLTPMPAKTSQAPSLLRARNTLLSDPPTSDEAAAYEWETGLDFDELNLAIGKSFSGLPGKVDGEPICSWMISDCDRDAKVRDETMRFVVSVPLYEAVTRRTFVDVSIRTKDGALASTAVLVDYKPKPALARWWDRVVNKWQETVLAFKLWRRDALPELLVSKEWKAERESVYRKARLTTAAMSQAHWKHGPNHRHWYVNFVASNPDLQGQGYGSKIMRKVCELADKERADCYLECGMEKNKRFYERFGFKVVSSCVLDKAANGDASERVIAYGMVRTFKE
jgi:ribosomal protein S18 acetylase RimI-like enzyme